jgi:hypothetical protein
MKRTLTRLVEAAVSTAVIWAAVYVIITLHNAAAIR